MIFGVFGLPRSGKTTYLCKIAKSYIKRGIRVYSNFPCHGCYKLDFSKLGRFDFSNCVLLIDEISLVADSRDWKNFNSDLVYFFTKSFDSTEAHTTNFTNNQTNYNSKHGSRNRINKFGRLSQKKR